MPSPGYPSSETGLQLGVNNIAALPPIRRIFKEDLGPDVPQWITRLLAPLNLVLQSIYTALNKSITFQENIQCQVKEFNLVAGAAATDNVFDFALTIPSKPVGVWLVCVLRTDGIAESFSTGPYASWTWDSAANTINISSITGLSSGNEYLLRVIVI